MGSATLMDTARVGRPTKACPVCAAVFTYGVRGPVPVVCKECRNATYTVKSWGRYGQPKLSPQTIKHRRDAAQQLKLSTAAASAGETVDAHGVRWRTIASAAHLYSVSENGQVRRKGKSKPMVLRLNDARYPYASLSCPGKKNRHALVHCLVAEAFIGPKPEGAHVRHLNGDKQDNRLRNLAYGSPATNARDDYWNGKSRVATIKPELVAEVRLMQLLDGMSINAIARATGLSSKVISGITSRRTYADVGFDGRRIGVA